MTLKTNYQKQIEARNAAIYKEYKRLSANPDNSKLMIAQRLMEKHNIHSRSTIWTICKKEEAKANTDTNAKAYYGDDESRAE